MKLHLVIAMVGLLALSQSAIGQGRPNLEVTAILTQQQEIRGEATARKGRYKDMKEGTRQELFANQEVVRHLLEGKTYTTDLPEHEQIKVVNALESIQAIVNKAEDERLICERHKPVGSHRTKTLCMTVAQRDAEQEAGRKQVNYRDQQCLKGAGGQCL